MSTLSKRAAAAVIATTLTWATNPEAATAVRIPMVCSKGPSGQHCDLSITVPKTVQEGSTFSVRIDATDSGKISHTGLNYIHDMSTELLVPQGTAYVQGSARIIPDTGSQNVRAGARVSHQGATIRQVLPARVENGSSYTSPSFEFQLKVTAAAGTNIVQRFSQYRVTANAFIIGDVHTVCDPTPKPYGFATTSITPAAPAPDP